jgi:hypothetical protein
VGKIKNLPVLYSCSDESFFERQGFAIGWKFKTTFDGLMGKVRGINNMSALIAIHSDQWNTQETFQWGGGLCKEFFSGRVQQIQLRTEGRENGNLGTEAPYSRVPLNLQMSEPRILIRLLRMYFPQNWEIGSTLTKFRNFRVGGVESPNQPPRYSTYSDKIVTTSHSETWEEFHSRVKELTAKFSPTAVNTFKQQNIATAMNGADTGEGGG